MNYRPLLGAAGGASLIDFSSSDPDTLGTGAAKVLAGSVLGHFALKPASRSLLVDRVINPVATATWNKGTQAGRAVTDFIKRNPEITLGAGGGAYLGAQQFEDFNEFLHEPVQIGDTKVYLKKPGASQKLNLMVSGALMGGATGALGGALLKPLIRGVPSAIASGANRAVDSVRSAASGSEKLLAPTAIGAASGALTDGYIEAAKEDGDVLRGLGRGAAFGGAQGALAGLLAPSYAKTLAGVAYPATVMGQQALNSYLGKPTVIETTLQAPEKDQGILNNAYVKGGLGALGTAGALYGASKLLDDSGPKDKKPSPKNRAKRKAKK